MAEEFVEFMEKLKQEPVKEQLSKLKSVVLVLVDLLEKFIDNYTIELSIIHNKIIKLETNQMKSKLPKIEVLSVQQQPSPNNRPIGDESVRTTILGEIKELFKENGEKNES